MKRSRLVTLITLLALVFVSCGGDEENGDSGDGQESEEAVATYSENGVTFEYPEDWIPMQVESQAGTLLWSTSYGPEEFNPGATGVNYVNVSGYRLAREVKPSDLPKLDRVVGQFVTELASRTGGEITAGPTATTVAGLDGYEVEVGGLSLEGETASSRMVFLFQGDLEYFVNCQYNDDAEETILDACDQVLSTFTVEGS